MISKNPEIVNQIDCYNRIYRELESIPNHMKIIKIFEPEESIESFTIDGYHLNELGNLQTAAALVKALATRNLV